MLAAVIGVGVTPAAASPIGAELGRATLDGASLASACATAASAFSDLVGSSGAAFRLPFSSRLSVTD